MTKTEGQNPKDMTITKSEYDRAVQTMMAAKTGRSEYWAVRVARHPIRYADSDADADADAPLCLELQFRRHRKPGGGYRWELETEVTIIPDAGARSAGFRHSFGFPSF